MSQCQFWKVLFACCSQQLNKARCGILIGSAFGGMQTFATAVEALEAQGECDSSPTPYGSTSGTASIAAGAIM
jgi:hypothetical protein